MEGHEKVHQWLNASLINLYDQCYNIAKITGHKFE
jgi:hypothetical protein